MISGVSGSGDCSSVRDEADLLAVAELDGAFDDGAVVRHPACRTRAAPQSRVWRPAGYAARRSPAARRAPAGTKCICTCLKSIVHMHKWPAVAYFVNLFYKKRVFLTDFPKEGGT